MGHETTGAGRTQRVDAPSDETCFDICGEHGAALSRGEWRDTANAIGASDNVARLRTCVLRRRGGPVQPRERWHDAGLIGRLARSDKQEREADGDSGPTCRSQR